MLRRIMLCSIVFLWCGVAWAGILPKIEVERIAEAIYKAENSVKYPYGIKSINTHGDKDYAYKICCNTIHNNYQRWLNAGCPKTFIKFLGDRYCPPLAHPLNHNWVKNVNHFLKKGG